jgi:hypothetical protein
LDMGKDGFLCGAVNKKTVSRNSDELEEKCNPSLNLGASWRCYLIWVGRCCAAALIFLRTGICAREDESGMHRHAGIYSGRCGSAALP